MKRTDEHPEGLAEQIAENVARWAESPVGQGYKRRYAEWLKEEQDEHREETGSCTCGGGYDPDCPADHGARPYYERLPKWVTFPLDSFDADDGTVDEDGALQWLRENELAAWPENVTQRLTTAG